MRSALLEEFDDVVENHLIEIVKQNQRNNEQHDGSTRRLNALLQTHRQGATHNRFNGKEH